MPEPGRRWLILVHQLPARPSNLRVRIWRRLQQVGAIVLRNSLYVLPATAEAREDFEWVRAEIAASGGHVSVFEASAVDRSTDPELITEFRKLRATEYEALADSIQRASSAGPRQKTRRAPADGERLLRTMRERFSAIQSRDYFGAPGRELVEAALAGAERLKGRPAVGVRAPALRTKDYRGRTWVTRPRPGIDRFASAYVIRRFIDPAAKFSFADSPRGIRAAQIPYDMSDVEFGHQGSHCTMETLMERFSIDDAALVALSHVVHDLDLKESRYGMPECTAVSRLVDGLRAQFDDDAELLEQGIVMIDALCRSFASDSQTRATAAARPRRVSRRK
jgi:hypothetical protein